MRSGSTRLPEKSGSLEAIWQSDNCLSSGKMVRICWGAIQRWKDKVGCGGAEVLCDVCLSLLV